MEAAALMCIGPYMHSGEPYLFNASLSVYLTHVYYKVGNP